jgi:hypothetical protein
MILRTSACDLPQNEQSVMREDLAMSRYIGRPPQLVEGFFPGGGRRGTAFRYACASG